MDVLTFVARLADALAWPLAGVILGVVFRKNIAAGIGRITRAKAGPLEVEMSPADQESFGSAGAGLTRPVSDAAGVTLDDTAHANDSLAVEKSSEESSPDLSQQIEDQRRAQIEVLIDIAAKWGWSAAQLGGFSTFPHPVVEWDEDGEPSILYGTTDQAKIRESIRKANGPAAMTGTGTLSAGSPAARAGMMSGEGTLGGGR